MGLDRGTMVVRYVVIDRLSSLIMNGSCHGCNWRLLAAFSVLKAKARDMFKHVPDCVSAICLHTCYNHSAIKAYEWGNPASYINNA